MHDLIVFATAFIAGVINALAGGGTLITFPTLIWLGVPSVAANATNTVAIWPGTLASTWAYRGELRRIDSRIYALVLPSVIGSAAGAILLYRTPSDVFDRLVPILIAFATCLFMAQEPIQRRFNLSAAHKARSHWLSWTMFFQLLVSIYGGYFGAGMGILMLAALSMMGHTDVLEMSGVKNMLATCINAVAAAIFVFSDLIVWHVAIIMMAGAIIGGIVGAQFARRIGQRTVRRIIIAIGFGMAISLIRF